MLLRNRSVPLFSPYVVLLSAFYDKELLANIFFSLIWKGRRSSINYEHGIFGLAFAGRRTVPDRWAELRPCRYSPHYLSNCGHQANETHLVSLIQGLVPPGSFRRERGVAGGCFCRWTLSRVCRRVRLDSHSLNVQ